MIAALTAAELLTEPLTPSASAKPEMARRIRAERGTEPITIAALLGG